MSRARTREIDLIGVDGIDIGERHRVPTEEAIAQLAASMSEIGLQTPIIVRLVVDDEGIGNALHLIAGATRLAAAKRLGWEDIEAIVIEGDAIDAEMIEIAENLHRLGLTKEQRDEHIRRYAELLRMREEARAAERERDLLERQPAQNAPPVLTDGRRAGPQHEKGIASKIAAETGLSKSTVNRALNPKPTAAPAPISANTSPSDAEITTATEPTLISPEAFGSAPTMSHPDREAKRRRTFDHLAFTTLANLGDVLTESDRDIPGMSAEEAERAIEVMRKAERGIRQLRQRIERGLADFRESGR